MNLEEVKELREQVLKNIQEDSSLSLNLYVLDYIKKNLSSMKDGTKFNLKSEMLDLEDLDDFINEVDYRLELLFKEFEEDCFDYSNSNDLENS